MPSEVAGEVPSSSQSVDGRWANVIGAVKTPLGFFSLAILMVEAILAGTVVATQGVDRTFLIIGMIVLVLCLILLVAGMAIWRPSALYGELSRSATMGLKPSTETADSNLGDIAAIKRPNLLVANMPPLSEIGNFEVESRFIRETSHMGTTSPV